MRAYRDVLEVETGPGISIHDLTPSARQFLARHPVTAGHLMIASPHTTTAIVINEAEQRLLDDLRLFLERLVPKSAPYLHNDIHLRDCPPDEPPNARAHLAAMLLGSNEIVPVFDGRLALGKWQSVLLIELDGPRRRSVALQLCGA
jgi:secondary thiamine-phosphate synthase enzyme